MSNQGPFEIVQESPVDAWFYARPEMDTAEMLGVAYTLFQEARLRIS